MQVTQDRWVVSVRTKILPGLQIVYLDPPSPAFIKEKKSAYNWDRALSTTFSKAEICGPFLESEGKKAIYSHTAFPPFLNKNQKKRGIWDVPRNVLPC